MSDRNVPQGLSRSDFLKLAGLSSFAALFGGVSEARAAGGKPERLYVVTHADDDADRAALALILASLDAKKIGKENSGVTVCFTLQGARLCREGAGDRITSPVFRKFGTLAEIVRSATKAGAKVAPCPFRLDAPDLKKSDYIEGRNAKAATTWRRRWEKPTSSGCSGPRSDPPREPAGAARWPPPFRSPAVRTPGTGSRTRC